MSDQIATAYSQKYNTGIELLAQQMKAVTRGTTRRETMQGKRDFFDQVGAVRAQRKTGRAVTVPVVNTPHSRRSVTAIDLYMRDYIDEFDRLKVLNDPRNAYSEAQMGALAREEDLVVIQAALGTAYTGEEGTTAVTLPASQLIAAGGTGFTFTKLKSAVQKLKGANALGLPGDQIHVAWTSKQEQEFIDTIEVKSSDYNNTKVLVDGKIAYFYGCQFHLLEDMPDATPILPLSGGTRSCVLWVNSGICVGDWKPANGSVDWLPERQSFQVYAGQSLGATRMQEKKVVQIDVVES